MHTSITNEQALEALIEKTLTRTSLEELAATGQSIDQVNEARAHYRTGKGYRLGNPRDFDKKYALDTQRFWHFLETTQASEIAKLKRFPDWKLKILERYDRMVKKYGVLQVLKKGLGVEEVRLVLLFPLPLQNSAQRIHDNFERNVFSVTRQLRYSVLNPMEEVDMVIFINGIPILTMELKNPWTGQTAAVQGQQQYKETRNITQPLFQFGRCLVHFAVDTDEVYMTTKLQGHATFFLPFNKGDQLGKGNPVNPNGHKTAYLWEEILEIKSLANIIQHFALLQGEEKDPLSKKFYIFPRYHQLDVVRRLLADVTAKGAGQTYLIQHSAGSGKSNSIIWTAFQLIEVYPESKAEDNILPLFNSVIVVTDRRILDRQIRKNIKSFSEVKNIIAPAHSSADLRQALETGKRIIITTIQKFPFIVQEIGDISHKRFAVIIDEAHSSQSGSAADSLNQVIGNFKPNEEGEIDAQDLINQIMQGRKMRDNASYFAFTATPKTSTFERFGQQQSDGTFVAFHRYSMKQAIEEGFILDVLANYTTYRSYYQLEKFIEENPLFDTRKAQKKLRAFVERDQRTIAAKAEVMLEHFIKNVYDKKKLKGKAKGMVITQSIESAVRYYRAFQELLNTRGNPFKIVIAFSGKKEIDGIEYTEAHCNGFSESETEEKFDTDPYKLLVVANKYLTGFDQPKLTSMYVDKKLQGVLCVQALSRLNRSANHYGKRTEDLFVLDFFNEIEDIKTAFDPFYTATHLSKATDVNVLHELKELLDDTAIYEWEEIEDFNQRYFSGFPAHHLSPIIDQSAFRFNTELELKDESKADIKIKAKHFVKIYGQVAAIIPFTNAAWEKLFWFLKFLIPKMVVNDSDTERFDDLLNAVDLSTYGLERVHLNASIEPDAVESSLDPQNANPRGAHAGEKAQDELEKIIEDFNEKWFSNWDATTEDKRTVYVTLTRKIKEHPDFIGKFANNPDTYTKDLAYHKIMEEVMVSQRRMFADLYKLWINDGSFKQNLIASTKRAVL